VLTEVAVVGGDEVIQFADMVANMRDVGFITHLKALPYAALLMCAPPAAAR
jgi:hypothetical protein